MQVITLLVLVITLLHASSYVEGTKKEKMKRCVGRVCNAVHNLISHDNLPPLNHAPVNHAPVNHAPVNPSPMNPSPVNPSPVQPSSVFSRPTYPLPTPARHLFAPTDPDEKVAFAANPLLITARDIVSAMAIAIETRGLPWPRFNMQFPRDVKDELSFYYNWGYSSKRPFEFNLYPHSEEYPMIWREYSYSSENMVCKLTRVPPLGFTEADVGTMWSEVMQAMKRLLKARDPNAEFTQDNESGLKWNNDVVILEKKWDEVQGQAQCYFVLRLKQYGKYWNVMFVIPVTK